MEGNRLVLYCFLTAISFNSVSIYANGSAENNPNEISDYFLNLIELGEIKPLSILENNDNEKYNLIISFLSEEENIKDYYYEINICVRIDNKTQKYLSPEKYNLFIEIPENRVFEIEFIEYGIWYYEAFFNKYRGTTGNVTGKCFTIKYNKDYEFIGRYYWK